MFQTEQRHGNSQPEVEKRIVQVLGKLTSVVASLHPQKMRDKMENFIKQANTQMLGNVRQNVLVEMREEANNRRSKEDSCQKGSLASTKLLKVLTICNGYIFRFRGSLEITTNG